MKKRTTADQVLEAVEDLYNLEQIVTRETLCEKTGLKLTTVDDRLKALVMDGKIVRVQRGVFVPVAQHPPARVISKTVLPDGTVKIDIGDDVLTLTPREDRMLASLFVGTALQGATVEIGHQVAQLSGTIMQRLRNLEAERQAEVPG